LALALATTQHHPPVNRTSERSDFPPPPSGLQLTDPQDPFFSTSLSISQPHLSVSLSIPALNSLSISQLSLYLSISLSLFPSIPHSLVSPCVSWEEEERKRNEEGRKEREREEEK
jgi:hypothetical protein